MDFKNIFLLFILLNILNKVCSVLFKKVKNTTDKTIKSKGLMNLTLLNSMDKEEFCDYVLNYLQFKGYNEAEFEIENIILCYDGKEALNVLLKKIDMNNENIQPKEVLEFISIIKENSLEKGLIITNGAIGEQSYKIVEMAKEKGIYITCINGVELAYELRNLNEINFEQGDL